MKQPEGYEDGTERTCLLVKTLYGLKQARREWNKELDAKLRKHKFCSLRSDPCTYVHKGEDNFEIVTVWVDDLMLFASSVKLIQRMKADLQSKWEMTDLREPAKIVGIEITRADGKIMITQKKYVENILRREGMLDANHVAMPMDPNIKLQPNPDGSEGN